MKRAVLWVTLVLASVATVNAKEILQLNLAPGTTFVQRSENRAEVTQFLNGQQMALTMDIDCTMSFRVFGVVESGLDIEAKYDSMRMKMQTPAGPMEFSSAVSNLNDIVSSALKEITTKSFRVVLTPTGRISRVLGIDSLFTSILNAFPQLTAAQREQITAQLKQSFGEPAFKGNLEMVTAVFPDSAVSVNDTWVVKTQLETAMAAELTTTYSLVESNDSTWIITGTSALVTADKDAYIQANGMPMKYEMKGTMKSSLEISKQTGWIMKASMDQTMDGKVRVKDSSQPSGEMVVPMNVHNTMKITD